MSFSICNPQRSPVTLLVTCVNVSPPSVERSISPPNPLAITICPLKLLTFKIGVVVLVSLTVQLVPPLVLFIKAPKSPTAQPVPACPVGRSLFTKLIPR
ncbi:MAG: hypothetical protein HUU44_06510 [Ignavibacteriaceae bacterium]|nr:hypothetical protein [Ignavibacteriaceae bacterium]